VDVYATPAAARATYAEVKLKEFSLENIGSLIDMQTHADNGSR